MKKTVAIILCAFAVSLFSGCSFIVNLEVSTYNYADPSSYTEYTELLELKTSGDELEYLSIEWINGEVEISSGHIFTVYEENTKGDYIPLYWKFDGDALSIRYAESGTPESKITNSKKKLVIVVPCPVSEIDLEVVNAKHTVLVRKVGKMKVDFVNGEGSFDLGSLREATFNGVNGDLGITVRDVESTTAIEINTVNGDSVINLAEGKGVDVRFSSVNGKLSNEFADSDDTGGKITIKADTVNGDLSIKKYVPDEQGFIN